MIIKYTYLNDVLKTFDDIIKDHKDENNEIKMIQLLRPYLKPIMNIYTEEFKMSCLKATLDFNQKYNYEFDDALVDILLPIIEKYISKEF